MKLFFVLAFLAIFSSVFVRSEINRNVSPNIIALQTAASDAVEKSPASANRRTVLVELFTSEGCSTCPPADKLLADLEREQSNPNAEVVALSLHVDYWDSPGWRDPYSQLAFSRRQDIYSARFRGENYTPQMIVDGREAFVGSDAARAQRAIAEAVKMPKANVELVRTENKLKIKIEDAPAHENANVFLAVVEENLAPSTVRGGENSGRRLAHASVVRQLKSLGTLAAAQKDAEIEADVQLQPEWKKRNVKLVVFLQENQTRKIFGTAEILFAS